MMGGIHIANSWDSLLLNPDRRDADERCGSADLIGQMSPSSKWCTLISPSKSEIESNALQVQQYSRYILRLRLAQDVVGGQ